MKPRQLLGSAFILLGLIISVSNLSMTGAVIGSPLSNYFSFLTVAFLVVGVLLMMAGRNEDKDPGELEGIVKLYHGALDKNEAETIRIHGPDPNKSFYLTPHFSIAQNAAAPNGTIITFEIPEDEFENYRELKKAYLGVFGEGEQIEVSGELAANLKQYLSEKDQRRLY